MDGYAGRHIMIILARHLVQLFMHENFLLDSTMSNEIIYLFGSRRVHAYQELSPQ